MFALCDGAFARSDADSHCGSHLSFSFSRSFSVLLRRLFRSLLECIEFCTCVHVHEGAALLHVVCVQTRGQM